MVTDFDKIQQHHTRSNSEYSTMNTNSAKEQELFHKNAESYHTISIEIKRTAQTSYVQVADSLVVTVR